MKSAHARSLRDCRSLIAFTQQCLGSPMQLSVRRGLAHNALTQTEAAQLTLSDGRYW